MPAAHSDSFSDALFAAYASGRLDPGISLLIETCAALRPENCAGMHLADAVGGAMLEAEMPAAMAADALDTALAQLPERSRPEARAARLAAHSLDELIRLPKPLQDHVFDAVAAHGWRGAGRGLKVLGLDLGGATEVELLRMEPGCGAPRHTHRGHEYTLVVSGGFSDERGSYGPGDISVAGPDDTHQPVADDDGVCLALAVREGGLQFTGLLGMLQRLLGR